MINDTVMSNYTIPNVIAQHPRGERIMDVYSHLLAERVIYLGTGIDAGVANALIAQLLHLDADSPDADVQFYINSEGGDPGAALAIYDTLQHIRPSVATTVVGQAIGPAALLAAAGTPGQRAALTHARIVLHQPAGQSRGAIPDLILAADEVVRVRSDMEAILARHTGRTVEALRADTDRDRVFTASAALDYGLIDTVLGERERAAS